MPELVKKLEDQLQSFSSQVDDLQDDLHKLVHVPKKTVAVKETPYLPLKNSFHLDGKSIF
jgi:hypothetical protein